MVSERRYTKAYAEMADGIQEEAESKLGRNLTEEEGNAIRNAGSLMMLESVGMGIFGADHSELVEKRLADAASAFSDRLEETHKRVSQSLEKKLGRRLSENENHLVVGIPNCLVGMGVLHDIEDADEILEVSAVLPGECG